MGRIIYLNGTPIGWNSKSMSSVTLLSTEVEYVSMSEGMKDLKFVYMCLKYLKMKVNLPMLVLIDNIRAIEMLDMKTGKCRTKQRYKIPLDKTICGRRNCGCQVYQV